MLDIGCGTGQATREPGDFTVGLSRFGTLFFTDPFADVPYMPPDGVERDVPACALDAERVRAGADPDVRKVMVGAQRVPYWQGGRAYEPYAMGYFGAFGPMTWMFVGGMMFGDFGGGGAVMAETVGGNTEKCSTPGDCGDRGSRGCRAAYLAGAGLSMYSCRSPKRGLGSRCGGTGGSRGVGP